MLLLNGDWERPFFSGLLSEFSVLSLPRITAEGQEPPHRSSFFERVRGVLPSPPSEKDLFNGDCFAL